MGVDVSGVRSIPNTELNDSLSMAIRVTFVVAVTFAARGSPVIKARSPKYSPGPSIKSG